MYELKISKHAEERFKERFPYVQKTLQECFDESRRLNRHQRRWLVEFTKSKEHRDALNNRNPTFFLYRVWKNKLILVVEGLTVVTVFRWNDRYLKKD